MYRVLVAIDSDQQRAERTADAISAFPGELDDLEVTILNIFEEVEIDDEGGTYRSREVYNEADLPDSVSTAKEILEKQGISVTVRRDHGDPAEKIISVANEIGADTIALTGRKRSPTGKVLFGSVTQSVLLSANQPVHVVIE